MTTKMRRNKGFFSISAVAKMFSVHQQTIRLYEKEGLINPKRSSGNTRLFSEEDVDALEEVIYLTHQLGINLAGVEMILKLKKQISKMQKDMNKLFDQTQAELDKENELSKTAAKTSLKHLMTLKQEKAPAERKQLTTATQKVRPLPTTKPDTQKTIAQEIEDTIDHWDIEYDQE
jgi:MerR family transcriptional regulator/heat shock protein HspR